MLEYSKNHHISEAYKRILEAQSLPQREYAYHCTETDPEIIKSRGFMNNGGGFTCKNQFPGLYRKYLPKSKCFVSKNPWDECTKYVIKIDITGLKKYPDFGNLLEYDAYYDNEEDDVVFWWEDKCIPENGESSRYPRPLIEYLKKNDGIIYSSDFDGELSWNLIGTCCVDGKYITPDRIVDITVNESSEGKTDWKKVGAIRNNIEERSKMLTPSEFSSCMEIGRNGGTLVTLKGDALGKFVSVMGGLATSIDIILSESDIPNSTLILDIDIEPARDWDDRPLDRLINYVGKYAPWIHLDRRIEDQRHMFARFKINDQTVLNSYRKLVGKDYERTDYVQMELF